MNYLEKFTSRKFLFALLVVVIILGNQLFKWGLSSEDINQILGTAAVYIGGESVIDASKNLGEAPAVETDANKKKVGV